MTDRPTDDRDALDPAELEAWQVPEPPADFADRVIAARHRAPVAEPAPSSRWRWGVVAAVAAAAMLLVLLRADRGAPAAASGEVAATSRQTVQLADRGVAVAEAGAELSWKVDARGAARVEQAAGNVFYRVERGGRFAVHTPVGVVTVTGTCFRVDVQSSAEETTMKPNKQLAIGAALGAVVVVTVYEGRVLFADNGGERSTVEAGESHTSGDGSTRVARRDRAGDGDGAAARENLPAPPAADATRDQLLARDEVQRTEIAQLREKVRAFESGAVVVRKEGGGKDGRPSFDPSREELVQWAKQCKVQFDTPPLGEWQPIKPEAGKIGSEAGEIDITAEEAAAINKVYAAINERHAKETRALYIEVTGDSANAETLSVDSMAAEIREKSPQDPMLMKRIAEERAGLRPPPPDLSKLSAVERYMRLLGALGDETERQLAAEIGPERARAIREAGNGWGSRMQIAGCPDEDDAAADVDDVMPPR